MVWVMKKSCVDCCHYRTEKVYSEFGKDRIGFCLKYDTKLDQFEFPNIHDDAEWCDGFIYYKDVKHESESN